MLPALATLTVTSDVVSSIGAAWTWGEEGVVGEGVVGEGGFDVGGDIPVDPAAAMSEGFRSLPPPVPLVVSQVTIIGGGGHSDPDPLTPPRGQLTQVTTTPRPNQEARRNRPARFTGSQRSTEHHFVPRDGSAISSPPLSPGDRGPHERGAGNGTQRGPEPPRIWHCSQSLRSSC